jgi:tetratricopeptide (TPR) repeat protein
MIAGAATLTACRSDLDQRLERLQAEIQQGRAAEALEPLRAFVDEHPERADAQQLLGIAYLQTGQTSLAVWPLKMAAEQPEFAVSANLMLATALLATENYEGAIQAATRVLEAEPERSAMLHTRARALLGASRPAEALSDADELLALDPEGYDALLLRAAALSDLGRTDEAEEVHLALRRVGALESSEFASRGCMALATFYEKDRGDMERAGSVVEECVAEQPTDVFTLKLATEFFDRQGQRAYANRILENALELAPGDLGVRAALANRLVAQGWPEKAEALLVAATEDHESFDSWRLLSELYRQLGRPAEASRALERAEPHLPDGADRETLIFQRSDLAIDAGDLDAADALAAQLEKPEYRELIRGRILLERGDAQAALAAIEAGTRLWPNNPNARYLAGRAALEMGEHEKATEHLREATRADGSATDAALVLAQLYLEEGRYEDTIGMVQRHLAGRPSGRPEALRVAARSYTGLGLQEQALAALEQAAEAGGDRVDITMERAAVVRSVVGAAAAAAVLQGAGLDLAAGEHVEVLRVLVEDLIAAGKLEEAEALIGQAISRQGRTADLRALRGRALLASGDAAGAQLAFEGALADGAGQPTALLGLAELALAAGKLDEAIALYDRAEAAMAGDTVAAYRATQVLLAAGRVDEAERRLRTILSRQPGRAHAANDLAWLLAEQGRDLDLALELAERAVRLSPSPGVLDTLGWVQLKSGRPEAALVSFRKALDAGTENPTILYHLGLAQAAKGDDAAAAESLRRALASGPFPQAGAARSELQRLRGG